MFALEGAPLVPFSSFFALFPDGSIRLNSARSQLAVSFFPLTPSPVLDLRQDAGPEDRAAKLLLCRHRVDTTRVWGQPKIEPLQN